MKKNYGINKEFISEYQATKNYFIYNSYKDLTKNPAINQLINFNYNTKSSKTYLQTKFNEKLIKSITKIQSFWKGLLSEN